MGTIQDITALTGALLKRKDAGKFVSKIFKIQLLAQTLQSEKSAVEATNAVLKENILTMKADHAEVIANINEAADKKIAELEATIAELEKTHAQPIVGVKPKSADLIKCMRSFPAKRPAQYEVPEEE